MFRSRDKDHPSVMIVNGQLAGAEEQSDTLILEDGIIRFAGTSELLPREIADRADIEVDARGGWLLPGFIDVHVHGGCGHDFMEADEAAYDAITRFHSANGTTAMLVTTLTSPRERISAVLEAVRAYRQGGMPYAQLLGVHLEGPFLSPKWPGAQNPAYIVEPRPEWFREWNSRFPGLIRMLSLAPERDGALHLIRTLHAEGIIASCAHTDASYEEIGLAVEHGLCHAAHVFNAMTGLHHRKPGTVGAVLTDPRISAEVICDGHHVHPACISILADVKRHHNLLLVTDAIAAAGLGDGKYTVSGLDVVVEGGIARLASGGALAGSTLTMIEAFRYMVRTIGLTVEQASLLASFNPAKRLGLEAVTGRLKPGLQADVLMLSGELELRRVWVKGREMRHLYGNGQLQ
jgi:N-acetylglucosamine-6-phosphate deacetylase